MISALPVSGAWQPKTMGARLLRPSFSFIRASLTWPKPWPPSSGPRWQAHRPWSFTFCCSGLMNFSRPAEPQTAMPRWEIGSTSSVMKSSIQSSFFWNSGSVSKSQAIFISPMS